MENSNFRETKRINIGRHFTDLPYSLAIHIHETDFFSCTVRLSIFNAGKVTTTNCRKSSLNNIYFWILKVREKTYLKLSLGNFQISETIIK